MVGGEKGKRGRERRLGENEDEERRDGKEVERWRRGTWEEEKSGEEQETISFEMEWGTGKCIQEGGERREIGRKGQEENQLRRIALFPPPKRPINPFPYFFPIQSLNWLNTFFFLEAIHYEFFF